jgi:hypothetical protein
MAKTKIDEAGFVLSCGCHETQAQPRRNRETAEGARAGYGPDSVGFDAIAIFFFLLLPIEHFWLSRQ